MTELILPNELIEYEGDVVVFNGVSDSSRGSDRIRTLKSPAPFAQLNKSGSLRSVASIEEACEEGQKIALDLQRIFA